MVRNGNMALYEIAKSWYEMVFLDTKWKWYETTIILHVYGRNMFIATRNLQIRVHVYRPRHYCGNWLTFGCFVPMIQIKSNQKVLFKVGTFYNNTYLKNTQKRKNLKKININHAISNFEIKLCFLLMYGTKIVQLLM